MTGVQTCALPIFLEDARGIIAQLNNAVPNTQNKAMGISGHVTLAYIDFAMHQIFKICLLLW